MPSDSFDYIFIDPPFGANLNYSELNFLWESWLKIWTNNKPEAIENSVQGKGINEYRQLMTACFQEAYRILKPGRWMTIEFSNTKASVWNSIQTALTEAGFIVANVSALDKKQGSFKAVTTPTAVKQDLVISAYKPNGGFEDRFQKEAQTEEGVWDFVRTHLKYLPVTKLQGVMLLMVPERDPRILFDQMIAYYVRKGYPVPISSQEFQIGLAQRFIERDGMYFLPDQVAEYDRKKMTSGAPTAAFDVRLRRGLRDPVAPPAHQGKATDLLRHQPAVHAAARRLEQERGPARPARTAEPELPLLRRQRPGARADPRLPLHQLEGAAQPAQGRPDPGGQGPRPLVRARSQQGGRPGEAAREGAAQGVRGIQRGQKEAQGLPPGSCPRRIQESLAGARLRRHRRRGRQDPQQRPGRRSQAAHVVRPGSNKNGRRIMARADLLIRLVQSGIRGDKASFRKVVEAIIAEERTKQHKVLAEKLEEMLNAAPVERPVTNGGGPMLDQRMGNLFHEVMPQRKLSDLILPDEVQQICQGLIQEQHRTDLLRSYNLEPRNRVLLIGPPGNGKTTLAEAIAEALVVPLLVVRYESVVGTYLGETAVRLKKLFEYASTRKCVLFFDEFETLGKERGDLHETGEIKRVVSSLLMQIDNLPSHVMVIGATNHAELLDRAVWRRFQVRMTLPGPTRARLTEWFEKFERRINIPLGYASGTLAKRLLDSNFAEVEEFGTTVFRQYVLEQPNANMKDIVSKTLQHWSARSVTVAQQDGPEVKDA